MRFINLSEAAEHIRGKTVAVVGSAPTVLNNEPGLVDSHQVVARINNYKTSVNAGRRTDVFYSFFGHSIKKTAEELRHDGVFLCMAKCPDSKPIESPWHEARGRHVGIDFRYIYRQREGWWFCDTYVPDDERFLRGMEILDGHVPTTGFAAILDLIACEPRSLYITGFDFFTSGQHNVDEKWKPGDPSDPIGHRPELERAWLARNYGAFPIVLDAHLRDSLT